MFGRLAFFINSFAKNISLFRIRMLVQCPLVYLKKKAQVANVLRGPFLGENEDVLY